MGAIAASQGALINYRHTPALLDGIHCRTFARWPTANNYEIIGEVSHDYDLALSDSVAS
jgi:hypothetical protein